MDFEFQEQPRQGTTWMPIMDVCERAQEIVLLIEMPGIDRADLQVTWNEGVLIISGLKRQRPAGPGVATYFCVERTYGHFRREISIKLPIDYKNAKAELKDGLLKVHLPKRKEPEIITIPIL
jgi:HSP20 family protein